MCPDWQCIRSFGDIMGKKILQRIAEFKAANCLEDLRNGPGRHEELKKNRKSQLSCHLTKNWRLIYRPFNNQDDCAKNDGLVWKEITKVEIIETTDYHGN